MALDTDHVRAPAPNTWRQRQEKDALALVRANLGTVGQRIIAWGPIRSVRRFFAGSLLRLIVTTNVFGFALLLAGLALITQHKAWLIDAKRDSLEMQGKIIAAAIAANATVDGGGSLKLDADKLPEGPDARIPFRDDGFAALEFSLSPERVTRLLRRLLVETDTTRVRIYDRDGWPIFDSSLLLQKGQIARDATEPAEKRVRPKTFWTRVNQWLSGSELPVYREIGENQNGRSYKEVAIALTGTPTALVLLDENGEQVVTVAEPIRRARAVHGVLLLSTLPGEIDKTLAAERWTVFYLAAVALLAMLVASTLLARMVAEPMRRLSAAAHQVSRSLTARAELPEFSHRLDEVGQMSSAFRAMTAALFRRIEASEKFAADVAHELKNPLTAARSTAESLAYARTEEQRAQLVTQIQNELRRLNRLITDVSNASKLDAELALQEFKAVELTGLVGGLVATFNDILSDSGRSLTLRVEPAPEGTYVVHGHEGRLAQVMTNLIDNAASFASPTGVIEVTICRGPAGQVLIKVEDDGPGIPSGKHEKIFERFYTDRPQSEAQRGKNSGLGLSITREIVRAHAGTVRAENRGFPGDRVTGARFIVELPRRGAEGAPTSGGERG